MKSEVFQMLGAQEDVVPVVFLRLNDRGYYVSAKWEAQYVASSRCKELG